MVHRAKVAGRNRAFRRSHPQFITPPAHLAFDAYNCADWSFYLQSGRRHAGIFAQIIGAHFSQTHLDVLEWGCGPGRLIRHLGELLAPRTVRLTGADYNPETIAWCRANLPGIDFIENTLMPPMELESDRFDAVFCFSVFTHLSVEAQDAWACELLRVLRPGGLLICTTHGDRCRGLLAGVEERASYNAGRVVIQGGYTEGRKWFLSVHPPAYVREHLLKMYEEVRRVPLEGHDDILQDFWCARKPEPGAASGAGHAQDRRG